MRIPPRYQINPEILQLIAKIDANMIFFSSVNIPLELKEKIQRVSLLKSSLFSARIEGNSLTMDEIETSSDQKKKLEVFNILKAIRFIDKEFRAKDQVKNKTVLELHKIIMNSLTSNVGKFRREMGAIFNQAGVAIYVSPPPTKIKLLMEKLLHYINGDSERFPLIAAFITHLIFEKIHPFIDGNGRVGRLLVFLVLKSRGYNFDFFIPFEEYLDHHKDDYYYYVDIGMDRPESYLQFMLKAFFEQTEKIKLSIIEAINKKETVHLPFRQEEIFDIIKDHRVVTFDFIRRRFLRVPARTLRYDIKKLSTEGLIIKIGRTRGCVYKIKD